MFAISMYKVFCLLVDVRKSCLDGGSHGDGLVGVDRLGGGAAEDILARLLNLGHPDEKNELFKRYLFSDLAFDFHFMVSEKIKPFKRSWCISVYTSSC